MSFETERQFIDSDLELGRMQEFATSLGRVSQVIEDGVDLDLSAEYPVANAISQVIFSENTPSTLCLNADFFNAHGRFTDSVSFDPRVARGGKKSFHGVFFGDIELGDGGSIPVAVKPHKDDALRSCLGDYFSNIAVGELGFPNLRPVGYVVDRGVAYSITELDETLTTLDSIDWTEFFPSINTNPGMREIWHKLAKSTAVLHDGGNISHGDYAARNIATTVDGGVFAIDWERALIGTGDPRDSEARYQRSYPDISCLLESMCRPTFANFKAGIGIFYGHEGSWRQGFNEIYLNTYLDYRRELAALGSHTAKKESEIEEEIRQLQKDILVEVDMQRDICRDLEEEN